MGGGGGQRDGGKIFAGCKPIGASAPNQCQIITFLTLKTDNIANLRIELKTPILRIGDQVPTFDVVWPKQLQEVRATVYIHVQSI